MSVMIELLLQPVKLVAMATR